MAKSFQDLLVAKIVSHSPKQKMEKN